jgi:hypothetical protein
MKMAFSWWERLSSRELRISILLPRFIAAESRSHQCRITQLKAKVPI